MIGLDFPVKPEWIHDVHALWQPKQPIGDLVQAALAQTMQELGGEKTRRNSLTVILRYFVKTEGGGRSRRTAAGDAWVAYGRKYAASTLAPAYLAHLVAKNEVARDATRFITQRYVAGARLVSSELRRPIIGQFGERKVVTNAASAFLRTLLYFGVLGGAGKLGHYSFLGPLTVPREAFPLIVWTWWQRHLSPQIDLSEFEADPAFALLQSEHLQSHWRAYQPALWVLEERIEGRRAVLKYAEADEFEQTLMDMLCR